MKLYLVQHGLALSEEKDPERSLSEEGKENVRTMAAHLHALRITAGLIWHSGKARSVQTAQIFAASIPHHRIEERNDIHPMDPVEKFPAKIETMKNDLMIVGHLPFLQRLASRLLTGSDNFELVGFRYAGVACLEHAEQWKIAWFMTPDLIQEGPWRTKDNNARSVRANAQ
jgi:phosphohistidine phosphatase